MSRSTLPAALYWNGRQLLLLDQRLLPRKVVYLRCRSARAVAGAIRDMVVRGAPAIGIAAACALALEARRNLEAGADASAMHKVIDRSAAFLLSSRPTAVNLAWAVERCLARLKGAPGASAGEMAASLAALATEILEADRRNNRVIGARGLPLIPEGAGVLTHCNAGALATGGWGTALAVVAAAHEAGRRIHVYVDETRPLLQGARLTAYELKTAGIPATLVTDNCAGHLMARGLIDLVIVGADRVAANGDVANKIGTYSLAVLAACHGLPFYVAAPLSTLDISAPGGRAVVIEERSPEEVTHLAGTAVAPPGQAVYNPAFDITPAALVTALVTEKGLVFRPNKRRLERLLHNYCFHPQSTTT